MSGFDHEAIKLKLPNIPVANLEIPLMNKLNLRLIKLVELLFSCTHEYGIRSKLSEYFLYLL